MKQQIIDLRNQGKTYREICEIVGCNKATVAYHCGQGQKEKHRIRQKKRRQANVLKTKIERFKYRGLSEKVRCFQRRSGSKVGSRTEYNFTPEDALRKFGDNPVCYLSGTKIDLSESKSYHLDHIIPVTKGGTNTLDNAGILDSTVNMMKHDLTPQEFIDTCIKILEYQGYKIEKEDKPMMALGAAC